MNFFDRISSYDLITSLIPGAFLLEAFRASGIPFVSAADLAAWLLLAYALGIFCNRVGSLLIEPQIQRFVTRNHGYADYVRATQNDERIESLVEKATFYRTMLTAAVVYLVGILVFYFLGDLFKDPTVAIPIGAVIALLIFLLSFLKQESFISKRVKKVTDEQSNDI